MIHQRLMRHNGNVIACGAPLGSADSETTESADVTCRECRQLEVERSIVRLGGLHPRVVDYVTGEPFDFGSNPRGRR